MAKVKDVLAFLDGFAPVERKMDFDNVGLLAGFPENDVTRVMTALDITDAVIEEAAEFGAELIVSHHPLIFTPLKAVTADDLTGRKVIALVSRGMSAVCMHTNLDVSNGGVNDVLAALAGIEEPRCPYPMGFDGDGAPYGLMKCGDLKEETSLSDYLAFLKKNLGANGLRYCDGGRPVREVAVVSGAGGSELMDAVRAGCDTFVTSEVKHNHFLDARELGVNLIDAGHFPTENPIAATLAEKISARFPELEVKASRRCVQTEKFF